VLFVCSDNFGRSLIAEYLLKDWLTKNNRSDFEVSSCGTDANSDTSSFSLEHFQRLKEMSIDTSGHIRTQLTKELLDENDIIIAMADNHQEYIKNNFGVTAPLFNELCKNEKSSIRVSPPGTDEKIPGRMIEIVNYINESIPRLVSAIDNLESKL
jgi:protein-tyrosine-phosphatase